MDEVLIQDTGYVELSPLMLGTLLTTLLILEARVHALTRGKNIELGTHGKVKERHGPPDVAAVLEAELLASKSGQELRQVVVSGK